MPEVLVATATPLPVPRSLSPTSASTWQQCELKYALGYLYGWQEPSTLPQLIGNVVHRAVELLYQLPADERTRAAAGALLEDALAEEVGKPTYAALRPEDAGVSGRVLAVGTDATDGLFDLEDPRHITVGPEGLEVWVSAELYGAPVRGRVDRLYDSDGAEIIADYKTGKVPQPRFAEKAFFGLWTYAAALAASDPEHRLADRLELLFLVGRERLVRPVLRSVALDQAKTLARIWRAVQARTVSGEVVARTSRLCEWCAFRSACPAQDVGVKVPVGSLEHDDLLLQAGLSQSPSSSAATRPSPGAQAVSPNGEST